ncbi:MAG: hypothetical protein WDZ91_05875 [Paenibacillaceae bacterium]
MKAKLDMAGKWLVDEISKELVSMFGVEKKESEKLISKSNLLTLLQTMPDQVHHDSPNSWARTIARQNKLRELVH